MECCRICGKPTSELAPFGDRAKGFFWDDDEASAKLNASTRDFGYETVGSSLECRDCFFKSGSIFELQEENALGRPLTEVERFRGRFDEYVCLLTENETAELKRMVLEWNRDGWPTSPFFCNPNE